MKKCLLIIVSSFSIFCVAEDQHSTFDQLAYNWCRTFAEVIQLANKKHFKITNLEQSMTKAIDAFLSNLDPHSSFLDPSTYKTMLESTSGQFYGIGIIIDNTRKSKDKFLTVVDTVLDGPSDKAGIHALDKIIEIDGTPLEGLSTEEAIVKLKGECNTTVHIKVLREGHPDIIPFDVVRNVIKDQNLLGFHITNHNIYYVSLSMFSENAVKQIEKLLQQSTQKPYKGLILDLRNNSGGLLNAAIDIAGLFLDKGSLVVTTKNNRGQETERYVTHRDPIANNKMPIFILINNYTASAAEILAACLKTHSDEQAAKSPHAPKSRVFLVGTCTFGKGSVQEVIPVSNNCAVKITTSLYFPNNINIQGEGIQPDFVIERTFPATEQMQWFTKHYGRESALSNCIKMDNQPQQTAGTSATQPAKASTTQPQSTRWKDKAKQMLQTDNQLREAISLINLLSVFQSICPDKVCTRNKAIEQLKASHITHDALDIEEIKL
jgi:carboxyl-terminal processing protease